MKQTSVISVSILKSYLWSYLKKINPPHSKHSHIRSAYKKSGMVAISNPELERVFTLMKWKKRRIGLLGVLTNWSSSRKLWTQGNLMNDLVPPRRKDQRPYKSVLAKRRELHMNVSLWKSVKGGLHAISQIGKQAQKGQVTFPRSHS